MHSDVLGPLPDPYSGARRFLPFIDEWSRFIVANPIRTKEERLKRFKAFEAHFEKQYEAIIKSILSDNGGEYTLVQQYAEEKVIRVSRASPYTPQSNGITERTNETLVKAVRTTLKQSGLTKEFWAESLANVVTVKYCIPIPKVMKTVHTRSRIRNTLHRTSSGLSAVTHLFICMRAKGKSWNQS
jgi:transposase InsO family protein